MHHNALLPLHADRAFLAARADSLLSVAFSVENMLRDGGQKFRYIVTADTYASSFLFRSLTAGQRQEPHPFVIEQDLHGVEENASDSHSESSLR